MDFPERQKNSFLQLAQKGKEEDKFQQASMQMMANPRLLFLIKGFYVLRDYLKKYLKNKMVTKVLSVGKKQSDFIPK